MAIIVQLPLKVLFKELSAKESKQTRYAYGAYGEDAEVCEQFSPIHGLCPLILGRIAHTLRNRATAHSII